MRQRRTARVLVFDAAGRVVLLRMALPRAEGEFVFWLTPGGEIEAGETELAAAARELREELGLDAASLDGPLDGPLYTEATQFEHLGEMRDNTDYFFRAQCAAEAPRLGGVTPEEIALLREMRWWSAEEIEAAVAEKTDADKAERFFPADLGMRVRQFGPRGAAGDG